MRSSGSPTVAARVSLLVAVSALVLSACGAQVLTLEVGTCFDDPESYEEVTDVPIVDCADPHGNEVIGLFDIAGDAYPGDDAVADRAGTGCLDAFATYIGIAYELSVYDIGWLTPSAESWAVGDREVICFAYDPSLEPITGTVRGNAA